MPPHNLVSTPEIEVEIVSERFTARLTEVDELERSKRFEEQASLMPQFGEYETKAAPRVIPVFELAAV
ncbi:MAG: hypothetical protein ACR2PK_08305 [Acidimicrobiales bacterium]